MPWWRRESKEPRRSSSKRRAHDVERLTEEGLLIAAAAIRMRVKNELIVRTLHRGVPFDRDDVFDLARTEIRAIITEKVESVKALQRIRGRAARRSGDAQHSSDYRRADLDLLEERERIDRGIGAALTTAVEDDDYVGGIVDAARSSAMDEMFRPWFSSFASDVSETEDPEERASRVDDLGAEVRRLAAAAEADAAAKAEADAAPTVPKWRRWLW